MKKSKMRELIGLYEEYILAVNGYLCDTKVIESVDGTQMCSDCRGYVWYNGHKYKTDHTPSCRIKAMIEVINKIDELEEENDGENKND